MRITNMATVSVPTTAGGTEILSAADANAALALGYIFAVITPSVAIALVDSGGSNTESQVPGAVVGTAANSALVCPAGTTATVSHKGGALRAIGIGSTSTVQISLVSQQ